MTTTKHCQCSLRSQELQITATVKSEKTRSLLGLLLLEATSLDLSMDVVIKENYVRTKNEPPKQKINQKPKTKGYAPFPEDSGWDGCIVTFP